MPRFLNRLLALPIDEQNQLFAELEARIAENIEQAIEAGSFEVGVESVRADSLAIAGRETLYEHPGTGAVTELVEIVRRDRLEPLDADTALGIGARAPEPDSPPRTGSGDKPRLAVNARSKRAAVLLPAPSRMFDDGGVQERVRLIRPATRETMARAELDASNWRRRRRGPAGACSGSTRSPSCRRTGNPASGSPPACCCRSGIACPAENMRVRRLATDTGEALIGRVLDAEQVAAVRTSFGLDGALAMTGAEAFEAVMGRGSALPLANGWRLRAPAHHGRRPGRDRGTRPTPMSACSGASAARWRSSRTAPAPSPPPPRCSTAFSNAGRSPPEPPVRTAGRAPAGEPVSGMAPAAAGAYPYRRHAARRHAYRRPAGGPCTDPIDGDPPMTAQTLPDDPSYCFVPAYDIEDEVQQIRIVIEGMSGYVPTALVTLTLDDALSICDKLNRRLGYDREAWTAMAAASMRAEEDDPDGGGWH